MGSGLGIRTLGDFAVTVGDQLLLDGATRPRRPAHLVKLLAIHDAHAMPARAVAACLWPDAAATAAAGNLYKCLHHLRAATRLDGASLDLVTLAHGALALTSAARVDLDDFTRASARAEAHPDDARAIERALTLYPGDLLPDDLYEPWTEPLRARLKQRAQSLRIRLAALYTAGSRYADAEALLADALASDPADEAAHRELMRTYAARGARDRALRQYERCRDALARDLDALPSADTVALAERVRRGETASTHAGNSS